MDPPLAASPEMPSATRSVMSFCDARPDSGSWLEAADFCDDFSDGTDTRWEPLGGSWEVVDNEYVGTGGPESCATGTATNETLIRDLSAENVEMRLEMRSQQRVDKGIILRSTGPGDKIALNFRADPFNDLVVQELLVGNRLVKVSPSKDGKTATIEQTEIADFTTGLDATPVDASRLALK